MRITTETTVTWEWGGGTHNVASTPASNSTFESERVNVRYHDELEYSFERTFDEAGLELYVCEPHENLGMRGAIDVVELSLPLVQSSPRTIRRLGFGVSM